MRSPLRLGLGLAMVALFGVLSLAGVSAELGLSVPVLWILAVVAPSGAGWAGYTFASRRRRLAESSQPRRI